MSAGLFEGVWSHPTSKKYIKIWALLAVLTIVEIGVVFLPVPHWVVALLLTAFACGKAGIVGWYYMHLNHETKWLRIVAITPLIAAFYAGVLMLETTHRPVSEYLPGKPREVPAAHGEHNAEVNAKPTDANGAVDPNAAPPAEAPAAEPKKEAGAWE